MGAPCSEPRPRPCSHPPGPSAAWPQGPAAFGVLGYWLWGAHLWLSEAGGLAVGRGLELSEGAGAGLDSEGYT